MSDFLPLARFTVATAFFLGGSWILWGPQITGFLMMVFAFSVMFAVGE